MLTAKQELFVEHYVRCRNGSEAARQAGYSPKHVDRQASALLRNFAVYDAIQERTRPALEKVQAETDFKAHDLLGFWTGAVLFDFPTKLTVKSVHEIPQHHRRYIDQVAVRKDGKIEVRFLRYRDRLKASELLARAMGTYDAKAQKQDDDEGLVETFVRRMRFASLDDLKIFRKILTSDEFRRLATAVPVETTESE